LKAIVAETVESDSKRESASECVAVCCSVLQCVAVCCSVLHCVAVKAIARGRVQAIDEERAFTIHAYSQIARIHIPLRPNNTHSNTHTYSLTHTRIV